MPPSFWEPVGLQKEQEKKGRRLDLPLAGGIVTFFSYAKEPAQNINCFFEGSSIPDRQLQ